MAASQISGPQFIYGPMAAIQAGLTGFPIAVGDGPYGPGAEYQGDGILDPRFFYPKDKVTGWVGLAPSHFRAALLISAGAIPAALSAVNIAAAQNATSGTALTLAAASAGISPGVPIIPFSGVLNSGTVAQAMALDFGFEFGNCTAGSTSIPVANGLDFFAGMPLVIAGVGNSGGTASLLTNVLSITGNTIVVANAPLATNATAAIGTGNLWGPNELGFPLPTAALPWLGYGAGLWLDSRQSLTRTVRVTGVSGGAGGTFTVAGWDIYGQPQTETITVAAGASIGYGRKAFKYLASVTPNFTDAHNYSVGTTDVFGLNYRSPVWDQVDVSWASAYMTSATGFVAPDATSPATPTTGDVRGTVQVSATGGGTGIGSTVSTGVVSSLAMAGNRLTVSVFAPIFQAAQATPVTAVSMFGVTPA